MMQTLSLPNIIKMDSLSGLESRWTLCKIWKVNTFFIRHPRKGLSTLEGSPPEDLVGREGPSGLESELFYCRILTLLLRKSFWA